MAMTDDERIIEALAKSRYESNYGADWDYQPKEVRATYREYAAKQLTALRRVGGDVTIPPAPEPTHVLRAPLSQFGYVFAALDRHESVVGDEPEFQALMNTVRALTPEKDRNDG